MLYFWNREKLARRNKEKGEAFLAENQKQEGVIMLPSGLQYKIIKEGTGETPKPNDTVVAHYRGTLIKRRRLFKQKESDSSYRNRGPATLQVNRVIAGWTEALQLMQVGAKWQLFVPPHLAYGVRGAGRRIGPNTTLIFEVELIAIEK